jgi:GDPmannose 4,6-dehydratase
MWRIVQHKKGDDFVLATGETHEVREFVNLSFKEVGIDIEWKGKGIKEKGINRKTGKTLVEVDARYFRPTEVELLIGDPTKAKKVLGWKATTSFKTLVSDMVIADVKLVKREAEYRRLDEEKPVKKAIGKK